MFTNPQPALNEPHRIECGPQHADDESRAWSGLHCVAVCAVGCHAKKLFLVKFNEALLIRHYRLYSVDCWHRAA